MVKMMDVLAKNRVHHAAEKQAAQELPLRAPTAANQALMVNNAGLSILSVVRPYTCIAEHVQSACQL